MDKIQNDTKIADYINKCACNKEKILKANGGMCDVVKELLENYIKGGMYLDDESFRLIQFHIYECSDCQNKVVTFNLVDNKIECDFVSIEDDCLQECIITKNKCLFFRKNRDLIITDMCGKRVWEKFIIHYKKCIKCKDYFLRYVELVYLVNIGIILDFEFPNCNNFNVYREYLNKKLLGGKQSIMLYNHYLLCDRCNDVYINSWEGYAERCHIDDRSDKI